MTRIDVDSGRALELAIGTGRGNAARHLRPGGHFVIETGVPRTGERFRVFDQTERHLGVDEYDPVTQAMWSHHYTRVSEGMTQR